MLNILATLLFVPTLLGVQEDHPDIHHPPRQQYTSWEHEFLEKQKQILAIKKELEQPTTGTPENLKGRAWLRSQLALLTKR